MRQSTSAIQLPGWLVELTEDDPAFDLASDNSRMELAIDLARQNVKHETGGPFGAVVVEENSGQCVAVGVNLVTGSGLSVAHAETVSIMLAQCHVGTHDLAGEPDRRYSLYTSGQPCVMCFGTLWWSGITKLVCGARAEDIEEIAGFCEGPLPVDWARLLAQRAELPPVEVVRDLQRDRACEVLRAYRAAGHPVYNPGTSGE